MKTYNVFLSTDAGRVREKNEDSFVLNKITKDVRKRSQHITGRAVAQPLLCGVFDGMGGETGGFEASDTAAVVAVAYYRYLCEGKRSFADSIGDYVKNSNQMVKSRLAEHKLRRGGTTFAFAYFSDDCAYLCSMGDSRIYLYRGGALLRVSRDHTLAQKKLEANIYTREEAEQSADSHILTRFLGMDSDSAECAAEGYAPLQLLAGDRLLLCSDGLYDMCGDAQIAQILSASGVNFSVELTRAALENGGTDNITCLVIEINSEG